MGTKNVLFIRVFGILHSKQTHAWCLAMSFKSTLCGIVKASTKSLKSFKLTRQVIRLMFCKFEHMCYLNVQVALSYLRVHIDYL
jgi:hypothetical protein